MVDGYVIDAAALEADAATFGRWGGKLEAMRTAVPVDLSADQFSHIPQAQDLRAAYLGAAKALQEYIGQGVAVLDGFERTLLKTVVLYADAEKLSAADVARVQAELAAL